jgi:secernin
MENVKKIGLWTIVFVFIFSISVVLINACDTWIALTDATEDGFTIFGKNSDRPLFDCQPLMFYPRKTWPAGSELNLGRLTVPQVEETYAIMGSSPYWCWGYEEGINEYSVVIGNEGIWTKVFTEEIDAYIEGKEQKYGPTGMDLVRLGLERGKTAYEALKVIAEFTEKYGQFGSGTPTISVIAGGYHNSYIITDPNEAWVLETAGNHWVAKRFSTGITSISNTLSIETDWDLASFGLVDYAIEKGWWSKDKADVFDFTKAYLDDTPVSKEKRMKALERAMCSRNLLIEKEGDITLGWMKQIARDRSSTPSIDLDQTASSCIAILPNTIDEIPVFWWCPATPSNSCYVPFFIYGSKLPEIVSKAGTYGKTIDWPSKVKADEFSSESYWWLFRDLCDKVRINYEERNPVVRAEFDLLEKDFESGIPDVVKRAVELRKSGENNSAAKVLDEYTVECVQKALDKVNELRKRFEEMVIEVPKEYEPYLGKYIANFGQFIDKEFIVLIQNGHLAVDVPGQMVFELNEPDEEGLWYFAITNTVAVSFEIDNENRVVGMKMHQTTEIPRKDIQSEEMFEDIPEEFIPYLGKYALPVGNVEMTVLMQNGHLALEMPNQIIIELGPPDSKGKWYFTIDDKTSVSFEKDDADKVKAMKLHQTFELPKKE